MKKNQIIDQELEQNQIEEQQKYINSESGKEGEEQLGLNYEGQLEGEMEEEEIPNQYEEEQEQKDEEKVLQKCSKQGKKKEVEIGEEKKIEENEVEDDMKEGQEGDIEECYENQNGDINLENEENKENFENDYFDLLFDNKYLDNNKNINNKKQIELLYNRFNLKNKKAQKIKNKENKNIIVNDAIDDKENIFNLKNNDVLSNFLNKVQDFKQKNYCINNKINSNDIFDKLDKELIEGIEKLNNNKTNIRKNFNEEQKINFPQYERKVLRNPKFKDVISLIYEKQFKNNKNYQKNEFVNYMSNRIKKNNIFSDINLYVPKRNNNLSNTLKNKTYDEENNISKFGKNSKKYYISCIDGKAIINGMRKEISFVSKLRNNDNKLNNNNNLFDDLNKNYNPLNKGIKTTRRNNSFYINKYNKNDFNSERYKTQKKLNINSGRNDINSELKKIFQKEI